MLAELSRPKARRLDPDVACQRARVAGVRYHARVCHVAALIHPPPLSSSPPRQAAAVAASLLRLAASASMPALHHAKLSLLPARVCRRTEPSPASLPPHAGPCCFYAIHGYKRRPPLHLVHNCAVFTSGKPSPPHRLYFSTAPSVPSRLTPPLSPCAGPGAPQGPGAASSLVQVTPSPPLSSEAIDRAGELSPPRRPPS
jgi:hypothetical protein